MTIRLAKPEDLAAIVAIYNQSIPDRRATADLHPVTVADRQGWFEAHNDSNRPLYVAEVEGEVKGFLSIGDFYDRAAYSQTVEIGIYIDESQRNQGLAHGLLRQMEKEADGRRIAAATAFIFAHNTQSVHLFKSMKYEEWGRLPKIANLDGSWADLIIFGKHMGLHPSIEVGGLFPPKR